MKAETSKWKITNNFLRETKKALMSVTTCPKCGKTYSSEQILRYHDIMEHSLGSIQCGKCPKRFPNLAIRSRHLSAHDGNRHSCNLCGKICKSQFYLYVHVTVVHHYGGAFVCHFCKKNLSKSGLIDHYVRLHAGSVKRLEHDVEIFCNVHSLRPFPEESWALGYVLNWPSEGQQLGAAEKESAAELEDHVIAAPEFPHGKSGEEIVCATDDDRIQQLPLRQLDVLDPEYKLNQTDLNQSSTSHFGLDDRLEAFYPKYELTPLNLNQSSTSIFRGLDLDSRNQPKVLRSKYFLSQTDVNLNQSSTSIFRGLALDSRNQPKVLHPKYVLNQTDVNQSTSNSLGLGLDGTNQLDVLDPAYELTQTGLNQYAIHFRGSCLCQHKIAQPVSAPVISNPVDFQEVFPSFEGKQKLLCPLCGMRYEDSDPLSACKSVDSYLNLI